MNESIVSPESPSKNLNKSAIDSAIPAAVIQKIKKAQEAHARKKEINFVEDFNFLDKSRPKDPYDFIDKKVNKISINP
jgi:rRNA-processing protein FCF1